MDALGFLSDQACTVLRRFQMLVYGMTFIAYCSTHLTRKIYTFVRPQMIQDSLSLNLLGTFDSSFMIFYALGNIFSGHLGDNFPPHLIIAMGLFGSAICMALFLVLLYSQIIVTWPVIGTILYLIVWSFHGLFQSTGGPVNTAVMG